MARTAARMSTVASSPLRARFLWQQPMLWTCIGVTAWAAHQDRVEAMAKQVQDEVLAQLRLIVGDSDVSLEAHDLQAHGEDRYSYHGGTKPFVVVYVSSTEQVSAVVALCNQHRIPHLMRAAQLIPYGSGTSLEGHTTAPLGGVCLDLSGMNRVLHVRPQDMDVDVQPGITWEQLNEELRAYDLFFPVDPGPGASIGGMVATGCSGTNAVRYGTMRANVLSLEVVLADGTVVRTGQRARKSSAGYDLTSLIVGSEGTLGVVTRATLRLQPLPPSIAVAVCSFPSVRHAAEAVHELVQRGVQVGCVELLDELMIRAVNMHSELHYAELPTLFFKFRGTEQQVTEDARIAGALVQEHGGSAFEWTRDPQRRDKLWEARKVALWASNMLRPGAKIWTTDVCVPISRLPDCIEETQRDIRAGTLPAPIVGHAGDGNFHVFILLDDENPQELAEAKRLNERMVRRAISMEGTCTGEHGVGVGKKKYLEDELGRANVQVMRTLKAALDPRGVLNPGKLVP